MKNLNCYEEYLVQKGYSLSEIRQPPKYADKRVPDWYAARYPGATYKSYREALDDFLNCN